MEGAFQTLGFFSPGPPSLWCKANPFFAWLFLNNSHAGSILLLLNSLVQRGVGLSLFFSQMAGDDDAKQLYRKFNILQSSLKPAECHPEEGVYGELEEEMLWSYMNEKGQIEDDYQLRKVK